MIIRTPRDEITLSALQLNDTDFDDEDDSSHDLTVYEMDALDYEETHRSVFSSLETAHESKPLPSWVGENY